MVAVVQSRPTPLALRPATACAGSRTGRRVAVTDLTYRRRRAAVAGVVVAVLVAVQGALAVAGGGAAEKRPAAPIAGDPFSTYVVQPGDTFWSIAGRIAPDSDPRPLVDRLVAEHGSAVLHVGERIALPERR